MNPIDFLEEQEKILAEIKKAKSMTVKVGLPADKVSNKAYGNTGMSVMQIGGMHEYGTEHMPQRSFLRMPFELKSTEVDKFIQAEFRKVIEGKSTAEKAMNRVGAMASNIAKEAFRSNGFGQWSELSLITKAIKEKAGKQTPLVWSGLLRNSITWSIQQ